MLTVSVILSNDLQIRPIARWAFRRCWSSQKQTVMTRTERINMPCYRSAQWLEVLGCFKRRWAFRQKMLAAPTCTSIPPCPRRTGWGYIDGMRPQSVEDRSLQGPGCKIQGVTCTQMWSKMILVWKLLMSHLLLQLMYPNIGALP